MKKPEMTAACSGFNWATVSAYVDEHSEGVTNKELAEAFAVPYTSAASMTRLMFEAAALARVQIGKPPGGLVFYFPPIEA